MRLKTISRGMMLLTTTALLSGCLNTPNFRGEDKTAQINQLKYKNSQLQRRINELTASGGQLANDNDQLRADNAQLKQRILVAAQALDKFRKDTIDKANKLADLSGLLELIGNEIVARPATLPIANRNKPVLLVNTQDRLSSYFVVRNFAGYFQRPTQVQLWLLEYQGASNSYQLKYRSNTFEVGGGNVSHELDIWRATENENSVYGFYFPNGNASLVYHPTSNVNDEARLSKHKRLVNLSVGQSIELDSSRDLQGVKISWSVMGLRQ